MDIESDLNQISGVEEHAMGQLVVSTMTSAIELSKLVIKNRIHNSQKMNDEDIYNIYSKSFKLIMKSIEEDPID